jgi:hypothetical protein
LEKEAELLVAVAKTGLALCFFLASPFFEVDWESLEAAERLLALVSFLQVCLLALKRERAGEEKEGGLALPLSEFASRPLPSPHSLPNLLTQQLWLLESLSARYLQLETEERG